MIRNHGWITPAERELLNKHLLFYQSLAKGGRTPKTIWQKHFVLVCQGNAPPRTEHEYAYMKHLKRERDRAIHDKTKKSYSVRSPSTKVRKRINITKEMKKKEKERISRILLERKKNF